MASRPDSTADRQALGLSLPRHYAEEWTWRLPKPRPDEWTKEKISVAHTCQPELRLEFANVLGVPMPTPNVLAVVTLRCDGA